MANLTKLSWPQGWNPSQDRNGDSDALLRMDNLQQDEDGCIGLVRGFNQIGGDFPNYISDLYTKTLSGQEYLYVGLGQGTQVLRSDLDYTAASLLIENGGTRPVFGDSLGQVYACSGIKRKKDRGPLFPINDLGIRTPTTKPIVSGINQPRQDLGSSWAMVEGDHIVGEQLFVDTTTLRGVMEAGQGGANTLLISGSQASNDPGSDRFYILIQPENTDAFTKFRVEIILDDDNYYWKEWPVDISVMKLGLAQQSIVGCNRNEFIRQGSDTTKDWSSISSIRVIGEAKVSAWFLANEARFMGGGEGQLNGLYEYVVIEVNDNNLYVGKSGQSPSSDPALIFNGSCDIAYSLQDPQSTKAWYFRRSLPTGEIRRNLDGSLGSEPLLPQLDQFYYIGEGVSSFHDNVSDTDALRLNIPLNEYLVSIQDIEDPFIGIEGLYNERMLYLTQSQILLSDQLNPDAIDIRCTIKAFGDPSEFNLWIKKISNDTIILGTTKDLYEITGSLLLAPNGELDARIRSIGERYPPVCNDFAHTSLNGVGSIFYISADGWRVTTGGNSALISPQLIKLFQKQDRYGTPAIAIFPGAVARYHMAVARNKLFCISQHTDGTRRLFIFDLIRKIWRLQYTDPVVIRATETDRIFLGFGTGSGNNIFEMDFGDDGSVISDEPLHGLGFNLETVLDHNNQPRNRKDTFTMKLIMDTGDEDVSVFIAKNNADEDGDWVHLGDYSTDGQDTVYIALNEEEVTLGMRYALRITNKDNQLKIFKLYEYTIEYDPRPEQNIFMRIPNINMGTLARKRWTTYAFIIDTLGNPVTFAPFIDNAAGTPEVLNKTTKLTYIYYFTSETVGTDIGGTLTGGPFEFYQLNLEETISEKLPTPTKFLLIPAEDYGNPNRKRHTSYKFQINTKGQPVRFTPKVDGVVFDPETFTTTEKRTVEYFFNTSLDVAGIDIGGTLETLADTPFEFYGTIQPQDVEVLPPRLLSFYIPSTNYGNPSRKRHTSYKFEIFTGGQDVRFTPFVDSSSYDPFIINTSRRTTVEYFFPAGLDVKGIDIYGHLRALTSTPFEFYKTITPEKVEVLPPRLKSYFTSNTNYGVPAKKRIRTIPFIIDTRGLDVSFTPIVDGVYLEPSIHNTSYRQTVFHYFTTDIFGTDFGAYLEGDNPFEFYDFAQPENVETIPVGKKYDTLQPFRFDKIGKLFSFRVRLIATGINLPYTIYGDDSAITNEYGTPLFEGSFTTIPNMDNIYQIDLPKNVNSSMVRIALGPTEDVFHRYDMLLRVTTSGMETDHKWVSAR